MLGLPPVPVMVLEYVVLEKNKSISDILTFGYSLIHIQRQYQDRQNLRRIFSPYCIRGGGGQIEPCDANNIGKCLYSYHNITNTQR